MENEQFGWKFCKVHDGYAVFDCCCSISQCLGIHYRTTILWRLSNVWDHLYEDRMSTITRAIFRKPNLCALWMKHWNMPCSVQECLPINIPPGVSFMPYAQSNRPNAQWWYANSWYRWFCTRPKHTNFIFFDAKFAIRREPSSIDSTDNSNAITTFKTKIEANKFSHRNAISLMDNSNIIIICKRIHDARWTVLESGRIKRYRCFFENIPERNRNRFAITSSTGNRRTNNRKQ